MADGASWKMRQAQILRLARQNRILTNDEHERWLEELKEPRGFWARLSWRVFGI